MTEFVFDDLAALEAYARHLATHLCPGDLIGLAGPLGAGKTVLARAMVRTRLDEPDADVPSPTYTLVQEYLPADPGAPAIVHADLYRLDQPGEIAETGLLDLVEEAVCLVEWPEKAGPLWPDHGLILRLTPLADGRRLVRLEGAWPARLSQHP